MTRQYVLTERAHLMCPNMHFGIKMKIHAEYDSKLFQKALAQLEKAHPFLQSHIAMEETSGRYYYAFSETDHILFLEKQDAQEWQKDYRAVTAKGWNVQKESLLKVIVYPLGQSFEMMFIAHHLLGDGRAILGIAQEFVKAYVKGQQPEQCEEQLIASLKDLPEGSDLPFISKVIINSANKNWKKEAHQVSYGAYLDFESHFIQQHPIHFVEEKVTEKEVEAVHSKCRAAAVSINDYLVAEMMFNEKVNKVVIAADIRKELACYHKGALGNYATAFGVVCKKQGKDVMEKAQIVSDQIKKIQGKMSSLMLVIACYLRMTPELIDAVCISTLGDFDSKAGHFVGSKMFGYQQRNGYCITNLGHIEDPDIMEAMFIPPASPANKKTMGVLTVNGTMSKCTVEYI